ncbi:MAG: peptidase M14 [Bacteroidetes bacterium]|jgi:hypothetical protein|nr:peptidase M14 [Bacteroidota bacterium]
MFDALIPATPTFRTSAAVYDDLQSACADHPDVATFHDLGLSEEGRPIAGVVLGTGPTTVSLLAGAHADEPVGPEMLRTFVLNGLARRDALGDLFDRFRFVVVPHINPDGEARNQPWITQWPDLEAYLQHRVRERPGRDLEFGFPAMRVENQRVAAFLQAHAPMALHMSLHGMGFSEGAMLLIERHWTFRTQPLRDAFVRAAEDAGLRMHDHNRKGEKGFFYVEPGFTTTPEGAAMRAFFRAQDDEAMARRFYDSSMEYARSLGGDPLCLVTELPLFVLARQQAHTPGVPATYLAFRERLPELQLKAGTADFGEALAPFDVTPLDLGTAMRLQLRALTLGLEAISEPLP